MDSQQFYGKVPNLLSSAYCGVYVHVPYCRHACSYCDFYFIPLGKTNSNKKVLSPRKQSEPDLTRFASALVKELDYYRNFFKTTTVSSTGGYSPSLSLDSNVMKGAQAAIECFPRMQAFPFFSKETASIYLGGGTPSLLPTAVVQRLVADIKATFFSSLLTEQIEVTIEVNPEDVDNNACREWKIAGINRISLGMQGVTDQEFHYLGRKGNFADSQRALSLLVEHGFRLSADLIIGHPSLIEKNLKAAIDYLTESNTGVDHLSLYLLNVPEGSALARQIQSGKKNAPRERQMISHYRFARRLLLEKNYEHYEISSFARNGQYSRHNSSYWFGHPYLGLGPSAESYDGRGIRRKNVASLKQYCDYWLSEFLNEVDCRKKKTVRPHLLTKQTKSDNNRVDQSTSKKNLDNTGAKRKENRFDKNQTQLNVIGKQIAYTEEGISETSLFNEYVMLRLRTGWGISLALLQHCFGVSASQQFEKTAEILQASGLLCYAMKNENVTYGKKNRKKPVVKAKKQDCKLQKSTKSMLIGRKNTKEINEIGSQNYIKSSNFLGKNRNKQTFPLQGKEKGKGVYYLSEEGLLFSDEIARHFFRL